MVVEFSKREGQAKIWGNGKFLYEAIFTTSASSPYHKIMDAATLSADSLRKQIAATEEDLRRLKEQLASVEAQTSVEKSLDGFSLREPSPVTEGRWPLSAEEYKRYGRQMIVPDVGIQG